MTPQLLSKIESLVKEGAIIAGPCPISSPSLVNYPACDAMISKMGKRIWGDSISSANIMYHHYEKGIVINGGAVNRLDGALYPYYETVASLLKKYNYSDDFDSNGPVRYTHRTGNGWDVYFLSNTTNKVINFNTSFRTGVGAPELWDAVTGRITKLSHFTRAAGRTNISLQLNGYESCFVVFSKDFKWQPVKGKSSIKTELISDISSNWDVRFDPKWGGPERVKFPNLGDWSLMQEDGIKYYSGIASYNKTFVYKGTVIGKKAHVYLDLGDVKNMASITLNGKKIETVWTAPWRIDITNAVHKGSNDLNIEVANLWANRLIGDEKIQADGPQDGKWPAWLLNGQPRPGKRYTFTTSIQYNSNSPLQPSGLLGPVKLIKETSEN